MCWVDTWRLRRSKPLGEAELDGTVVECMIVELQEQMLSFEDHVVELNLIVVGRWSHSVAQESGRRRSEPMEPYTEVQRVVEWVENVEKPRSGALPLEEDTEVLGSTVADR